MCNRGVFPGKVRLWQLPEWHTPPDLVAVVLNMGCAAHAPSAAAAPPSCCWGTAGSIARDRAAALLARKRGGTAAGALVGCNNSGSGGNWRAGRLRWQAVRRRWRRQRQRRDCRLRGRCHSRCKFKRNMPVRYIILVVANGRKCPGIVKAARQLLFPIVPRNLPSKLCRGGGSLEHHHGAIQYTSRAARRGAATAAPVRRRGSARGAPACVGGDFWARAPASGHRHQCLCGPASEHKVGTTGCLAPPGGRRRRLGRRRMVFGAV
eukprot:gene24997-biopygen13494